MRTETQGDLDVRPDDAVTATEELPHLAGLLPASEQQHDPHAVGVLAGLAEAEHGADGSPVETVPVERKRVVMSDGPPTVELYPPRVPNPPPVPDRDEPMFSARSILAREHVPIEAQDVPKRQLTVARLADNETVLVRERTYVKRHRFAPWVWIALAAVLVPLALATTAVLAARADAAPVPHTPPEAPVTAPTPSPSPYGLSVVEHGPAPFVAGLLDVHGGGAR